MYYNVLPVRLLVGCNVLIVWLAVRTVRIRLSVLVVVLPLIYCSMANVWISVQQATNCRLIPVCKSATTLTTTLTTIQTTIPITTLTTILTTIQTITLITIQTTVLTIIVTVQAWYQFNPKLSKCQVQAMK